MSDDVKRKRGRPVGSKSTVHRPRNTSGIRRLPLQISCQPAEAAAIRQQAAEAGKTVSAYILDIVLKRTENAPDTI